ncbi:hypothetical protein [Streptosporangium sp. NPDC002524]|uniref:hypothetical protein n=1 Tax=Streptosporangium sp. NPDC002524 TaxID=3154537 RepID=UPI003328C3C5
MTSTTSPDAGPAWLPEGLRTRRPTALATWPLVLLDGEPKTGKKVTCAAFTGSKKISYAFWVDVTGDGTADQYGLVEGADYNVVEVDGTWHDLMAKVELLRQAAEQALAIIGRPALITVDMVAVWKTLSKWARERARRTAPNRAKVAADSDADIETTHHYWNDATDRHNELVAALRRIPAIVIMLGGGRVVVPDEHAGQAAGHGYIPETQKGLGSAASVWVRLVRDAAPAVIGYRPTGGAPVLGAHAGQPLTLDADWSLETLLFDTLGFAPERAAVASGTPLRPDRSIEQIREETLDPATGRDRLAELYQEAKPLRAQSVTNEFRKPEPLGEMIIRLGKERTVSDPDAIEALEASIEGSTTTDDIDRTERLIRTHIGAGNVGLADQRRLWQVLQRARFQIDIEEAPTVAALAAVGQRISIEIRDREGKEWLHPLYEERMAALQEAERTPEPEGDSSGSHNDGEGEDA